MMSSVSTAIPAARPISFDLRHALRAFLFSGAVYGFFLCWAVLLARIGVSDSICLMLAHVGGAAALLVCWKLGRWGSARFDSFGAALLLLGVGFRVFAFFDTLVFGTRIDVLYDYRTLPLPDPVIDLLLKGELITVVGMLLIACSWRVGVGARIERFSLLGSVQQVPLRLPLLVYGAAIAINVAKKVIGLDFGPLEQVLSLAFTFGVAAIYFISIRKNSALGQVTTAGVLALPLSLLALATGIKEEMLYPFIPAAILYWTLFRHPLMRASAIILGLALFGMSQLYVQYVRETTWRSTGDVEVSTGDLLQGFGQNAGEKDSTETLKGIGLRLNLTTTHATTVTLADNRGYVPMEIFGLIPASLVPRVLWPGKPVLQPGAMHTARILGGGIPISQIKTATAAGFLTELYLGGSWWGMILGSILYGVLLAAAQKWALGYAPGFGHGAYCFLVLYSTLRFDEKHVVYAYTSIIFTMAFIWMLKHVSRLIGLGSTVSRLPAVEHPGGTHV
ncbi:MAG: hypothetical protein QM769_04765 [Pseudoxanthomonas sp.]